MENIKVSIVVPIYNLEKYVPRCMEALVNQTLEDIEIICVDDGSTDSAPQIIESYKEKYPQKVKVFHKENGGEWSARNYGLKKASGKYVGFIDSDDVPEITWAEKLYNAAEKNNADIAFSGYDRIDLETGKVVNVEMTQYGTMTKKVDYDDDFIVFVNPSLWNKIYKREKVKNIEFLPFRGCNDTLFLIHALFDKIETLTFIPDVLYHYYLRQSSQIHNIGPKDIDNLKKYLLVTKQHLIDNNTYEKYKYLMDEMAFLHLGISWMHMVSYNKNVKMNKMLRETKKYLNENFPQWKSNRFLGFSHNIKKGIKFIAISVVHKLYKLNLAIIYIKLYKLVIDVFKKEIKW